MKSEERAESTDRIRLLLFDVGGPLVRDDGADGGDPLPVEVLSELGLEIASRDLRALFEEGIDRGAPSPHRYVLWRLCAPDRGRYERALAGLREHASGWLPPLTRGVREVLTALSRDYVLGTFSAYSLADQRRFFEAHELLDLFPHLVSLAHSKSDPRSLPSVVEAYGARPEETVLVGDRRDQDVAAARRAGARSVLFRTGTWARQVARSPDEEPDATIDALDQLPGVLRQLGGRLGPTVEASVQGEALYRSRGCFACGTDNLVGLDMAPIKQGDEVTATFRPRAIHRGWSKLVHGGILATALDEVLCLAAAHGVGRKVLTVRAEVRYTAPCFLGVELTARGRPLAPDGRYRVAEGEVVTVDGTVVAKGRVWCLAIDESRASRFLERGD